MNDYLPYYRDKKILVTGAAGYLGSGVINVLSSVSCEIVALTRKTNPSVPAGEAKVSFVQGDIREKDIWDRLLDGVDTVFHFAAQTSSRAANEDPLTDINTNFVPVVSFIQACRTKKLNPSMIFAGTVTEVGLTETYPVDESFPDRPVTVYDINKLMAEKYLQYYAGQENGKAVTLRLANLYGPGPGSSRPDRGILNLMVRKALRAEPLTVYGEGLFIRDYLYIDDAVAAFLAAGAKCENLSGRYYLIGSGRGHSIREMVDMIRDTVSRHTSREIVVEHVPWPEGLSPIEARNFIADSSAFRKSTGWEPGVELKEGIGRTIDYCSKEQTR
jgi:nucleoside-diphosphate-sugar epimerase